MGYSGGIKGLTLKDQVNLVRRFSYAAACNRPGAVGLARATAARQLHRIHHGHRGDDTPAFAMPFIRGEDDMAN